MPRAPRIWFPGAVYHIIQRGNIEERLKLLDETDLPRSCTQGRGLDAIVIAAAGLVRLGLKDRITQRIPLDILRPHPLQGSLAIEVRKDNEDIIRLCRECLSQPDSRRNF